MLNYQVQGHSSMPRTPGEKQTTVFHVFKESVRNRDTSKDPSVSSKTKTDNI